MNHTLEKVAMFHRISGAPLGPLDDALKNRARRQLRVKLQFEELKELAEALDVHETFHKLCGDVVNDNFHYLLKGGDLNDSDAVDIVAALDAVADSQVILSGTIIELGFKEVFDDAFTEVCNSNLTKFPPKNIGLANIADHLTRLTETGKAKDPSVKSYDKMHYVFEREDGKILKGPGFKEPNLEPYVKRANDLRRNETEW